MSYLKKFLFAVYELNPKGPLTYPQTTSILTKINEGYQLLSAKEFIARSLTIGLKEG
jgi:hypothetical protein